MPAVKSATRKATSKAVKGTARRTMSAAHMQALSEGRAMSSTVDRYLAAVNTPKRRGRRVSKARLTERLADARVRVKAATGVERVLAAQEIRDLESKLAHLSATTAVDVKGLEAAFVKIARRFGENRGIG